MTARVAALYIDPNGPYPELLGSSFCWDAKRDARGYAGPWPVVAHPPCGPYSKLKQLYQGAENDCALIAVAQVRVFGGVLEHPAHSTLWKLVELPRPGELMDTYGGFTIQVEQCAWGHVARKKTWLYIVGAPRDFVEQGVRTGGVPTHWASGSRNAPRGPVPDGIKVCSAEQRRKSPPAFAEWLIEIARSVDQARLTRSLRA
jgi:hypothetical protein